MPISNVRPSELPVRYLPIGLTLKYQGNKRLTMRLKICRDNNGNHYLQDEDNDPIKCNSFNDLGKEHWKLTHPEDSKYAGSTKLRKVTITNVGHPYEGKNLDECGKYYINTHTV